MHKFSHHNAQRLENPGRYELLRPQETLTKLGLKAGMTFIDIGAGTGFFSRAAAQIVGKNGKVIALDMSEEMLAILKDFGVSENTRVYVSQEYALPVEESLGDFTLLSTVLHENTDVRQLLREASRVTKSSGKIVILEWKKQSEEIGPPMSERLGYDELIKLLPPFEVSEQGDLTRSHYYIVLKKNTS